MPTDERQQAWLIARHRLIASRYVRDDRPRVRVMLPRTDPIVRRALLVTLLGLLLMLLARLLNPV